jgi:hypothetical protein
MASTNNIRASDVGTTRINILLTNLWHSMINPFSITFEYATLSWYDDLHLHGCSAMDTSGSGIENKIFQVFDVTSPTHYSTYICPCSMFAPVFFYTSPPSFDKADLAMAFAE